MLIWESSPLAEQAIYRCCICLATLREGDIAATRHRWAYFALPAGGLAGAFPVDRRRATAATPPLR